MATEPSASSAATAAPAPSPWLGFWGRLSTGERVAFAGAVTLVVVGTWLLADLLGWAGSPIEVELAAGEIALLIYARAVRPGTTWPIPYPMILGGTAAVLVIPTISSILGTIHVAGALGGADLVGLLVNWIASLAVGVGAFMVWQDSPR